jgi:Rps23 Pro-64 3,4-dihydroxylase Tpa1-like proline 4-hydroxylase
MNIRQIAPGIIGYSDISKELMDLPEAVDKAHDAGFHIWERVGTNTIGNYEPIIMEDRRKGWTTALNREYSKSESPLLKKIASLESLMTKTTFRCFVDYKSKYSVDIKHWEGWAFLKYNEGDFFAEHTDDSHEYKRQLSMVYYPNDNYAGGDLEFTYYGISVKPLAGELILFPSNYMYVHKSHPITKGTKYCATSFAN